MPPKPAAAPTAAKSAGAGLNALAKGAAAKSAVCPLLLIHRWLFFVCVVDDLDIDIETDRRLPRAEQQRAEQQRAALLQR
jgi:hypothetical protein